MNALQAVESVMSRVVAVEGGTSTTGVNSMSFGQFLGQGVANLDASVAKAEGVMVALSLGENVPAHEVMIAMERARFSMQFAVELRNRLVDAYSEVMRMQV